MTKYQNIANDIRNKIINKEYPNNSPLPYEYELCKQYNCSKQTMKKALQILVFEGLIYRQRGKGTFVKSTFQLPNYESDNSNLLGNYRTYSQEYEVQTKILEFFITNPSTYVSEKLNISNDEFVYVFKRLRSINNVESKIEYSYVPIQVIPGLQKKDVGISFFTYVEEVLGLKIKSVHKKTTISPSDKESQELLKLDTNEPVAITEEIHFLSTGEIFEYSLVIHSYKDFVITSIYTD